MEKSSQGIVLTGNSGTITGKTLSAANFSPSALVRACARDAQPATVPSLRSTVVICVTSKAIEQLRSNACKRYSQSLSPPTEELNPGVHQTVWSLQRCKMHVSDACVRINWRVSCQLAEHANPSLLELPCTAAQL